MGVLSLVLEGLLEASVRAEELREVALLRTTGSGVFCFGDLALNHIRDPIILYKVYSLISLTEPL